MKRFRLINKIFDYLSFKIFSISNLSNVCLSLVVESCCPCTPVGCDGNVGVRPSHDKTRNKKAKDHHRPEVGMRSRGPVQGTGRKIFYNICTMKMYLNFHIKNFKMFACFCLNLLTVKYRAFLLLDLIVNFYQHYIVNKFLFRNV